MAAARVEGRDIGEGPPVIALPLNQPEDDGKQGATGEQDPDRVEILIPAETNAGKQPDAKGKGDDPDRHIDPEHRLPAEVGDEKTAEGRTRYRGDAGDGAPDTKGRPALVGRKDVCQDAQRLRGEDGAADSLDDTRQNQLPGTLRQAAADRRQGEDRQPDQEEALGAIHVAQPARRDQQHGVDEDVGV